MHRIDAAAAFICAAILAIALPVSVFQRNEGVIAFSLGDVWLALAEIYVATAAVLWGGLWGARRAGFRYAIVFLVTTIICIWIQGTLLSYDLGSLDGHPVDWSCLRRGHLVEVATWGTAFFIAFRLRRLVQQSLVSLLVGVLILAVGPLMPFGTKVADVGQSPASLYFDGGKQFEFSSSKNVVIIVIDTARSDAFEQILARRPHLAAAFDGFTLFRNAVGGYSITKPSIPLILSGEYFENGCPFPEYMAQTAAGSIPSVLKKEGFFSGYYSFAPFAYLSEWSNASATPTSKEVWESVSRLYNVTCLRYAPLVLKPSALRWFYEGKNFWGKDMVELERGIGKTAVGSDRPVFKFVHLTGAHPLFLLDRNLQRTEQGNYLDQLEGAVTAVAKWLGEMRRAGVFRNSMIMIVGDHGSTEAWDVPDALRRNSTMAMLNGMPLMLAKDFGETAAPLASSDNPVSLSDVARTVFTSLAIPQPAKGRSIFEPLQDDRSRVFYYYNHWQQRWAADYLPPLYKFSVAGHVRSRSSWKFSGDSYCENGRRLPISIQYRYGEDIVSSAAVFVELCSSGLREEEAPGAWATGPMATVFLPVERTKDLLTLSFALSPYLEEARLPIQRAIVRVDDEIIGAVQLNQGSGVVNLPLRDSATATGDGEVKLSFEFPDANLSPRDLGRSNDFRCYAGFFEQMVIRKQSALPLPARFDFGLGGGGGAVIGRGWSTPEQGLTWTVGGMAELSFRVEHIQTEALQLTLAAFPLMKDPASPQFVKVSSAGTELGQWEIGQDGIFTLPIPAEQCAGGLLNLRLDIPGAVSPSSLGLSDDRRVLGIAVRWIQLDRAPAE